MKARFRIWFFAGLLLAVVNLSGPAARPAALRAQPCITWVDNSRCDRGEISEPWQSAPWIQWQSLPQLLQNEPSQRNSALDRTLFQRPPPSLLLS